MNYDIMTEQDVPIIAKKYMEYYNGHEDGCWKYDKACKRIHQMVTIEDSLCLVQRDHGEITGFVIGFFKEYDDLTEYTLEGSSSLRTIKTRVMGKRCCRKWSAAQGSMARNILT